MSTLEGFTPVILSSGRLRLSILPFGLTLHALELTPSSASGSITVLDLLIGPESAEHYKSNRSFFNTTVGRYANRLPSGKSTLPSGAVIDLPGSGVCLHGGEKGLDQVVWDVKPLNESKLFSADETKEGTAALFYHKSEAGTDGFPLTVEFEGLIALLPEKAGSVGSVKVTYRAKIVEEGKEEEKVGTPVNVTNHWGFNLSRGFAEGAQSHKLFVSVSHVTLATFVPVHPR